MSEKAQTKTAGGPDAPVIESLEELLAHAYALELDAVARYTELAAQMEVHNNPELAVMFAKLAKIEQLHADQIAERAKGLDLPTLSPWDYQWPSFESPEAVDSSQAHYLMTPYQALLLSLAGETAARDFYQALLQAAENPEVRALAEEFVEEEEEHVRLIEEWMAKYPAPEPGWNEDLDEPVSQE
ncbi:MAG: ferritin family protein [Alphaproteobacteria bacterium]|nr:ferritin family protein [Alphaproteobacteria bacterium]